MVMMVMTNLDCGNLATHRSHFDFFTLHRCHLVEGEILTRSVEVLTSVKMKMMTTKKMIIGNLKDKDDEKHRKNCECCPVSLLIVM